MAPKSDLSVDVCVKPGTYSELVLGLAVLGSSVVAVGGQGSDLFLISENGIDFREGNSPGPGLRSVWWTEKGLWVVGEYGYAARSTDGGVTWDKIALKTKECLFGVVEDADGVFWIGGSEYLGRSEDGKTFKPVKGVEVSMGRLTSTSRGVLVPTDAPGLLYIAKGKGVEKTKAKAGTEIFQAVVTPTGAIVGIGNNGLGLRAEKDKFEKTDTKTKKMMTGLDVLSDGRIIAVGDAGVVIVSDDDGKSWSKLSQYVSSEQLWCVKKHPLGALIGGTDGTIFRVTSPSLVVEAKPATIAAAPPPEPPAPPKVPQRPEWAPPPPSTARQAWTRPDMPIENIDGIFWTPMLRALVAPRRGGVKIPIRPLPTMEQAWGALRRALWAADRSHMQTEDDASGSGIWALAASFHAKKRALGERILDPKVRLVSAEEDAALVSMTFERYSGFIKNFQDEIWEALADFLVAANGMDEALRRAFVGLDDELPYTDAGPFSRFRELLVLGDGAAYESARKAVVETLEVELPKAEGDHRFEDLKWAATYLFPLGPEAGDVERTLHESAMKHVVEFGSFGVHACGLAAGDLATLERFRKANSDTGHEFFSGTPKRHIAAILDIEGKKAAKTLCKMKLDSPWEDSTVENEKWISLLAHIDDDEALETIHKERKGKLSKTWGIGALVLASRFNFDRVMALAQKKKDKELIGILEQERGKPMDALPPLGNPALDALSTPILYEPPPAIHPVLLENPFGLEPQTRFREEEQRDEDDTPDAEWDGAQLFGSKPEIVDAFALHCERWAIPTGINYVSATPERIHPRLFALGFEFDTEYYAQWELPRVVRKCGTSAIPLLVATLQTPKVKEHALDAAEGIGDLSIAPAMIEAFAGKKNKASARTWMVRHPKHAAAGALIVFSKNPDEPNVARFLRFLDSNGHRDAMLEYAKRLGVESQLVTALDRDPLDAPKVKAPVPPKWATPSALPKLMTESGAKASNEETAKLLVQLAFSNADEIHPGVLAAKRKYTAASRAKFAWVLFETWLEKKADPKQGWCMQTVGFFGDDECARKLAALAKGWPATGGSKRAQAALDALLNIGSDAALVNINLLAEKSQFAAFKAAARACIEAIADARGLTADELADRLVPTLGLEEKGADVLDFGKRKFTITFDEALAPVVKDADGKVLSDLPKPGKGDDPKKAKLAKEKFSGMKKDARTSAQLQIRRLERAMRSGRKIDGALFLDAYAQHPWMRHLARRLVWGAFDGNNGTLTTTFRVAEDGTLADANDDTFTLPPGARAGVMHPIHLPAHVLSGWGQTFAEYQLIQPFPQIARAIHTATPAESNGTTIDRFRGKKVEARALRGLESRGWERWMDDVVRFAKRLGGGAYVEVVTDPGWHPSQSSDEIEDQTIESIELHGGQKLGSLPPLEFSEIVCDVEAILGL